MGYSPAQTTVDGCVRCGVLSSTDYSRWVCGVLSSTDKSIWVGEIWLGDEVFFSTNNSSWVGGVLSSTYPVSRKID